MNLYEDERDTAGAFKLLDKFAELIEATGGVLMDAGVYIPMADEEWVDMGELYVEVCGFLKREPKIEGCVEEPELDV
jgi:hypothetical protein